MHGLSGCRAVPPGAAAAASSAAARLCLLPGLGCDAALFEPLRPWLTRPTDAPAWLSQVHHQEADLPAMAARLLRELAGPLRLVGVSMGGMLALEVWRQAPQRIQGLALLGTSARPDAPAQRALRLQAADLLAAGQGDDLLRANALFAFHPRQRAVWREAHRAMMDRAGAAQLARQNRAVALREDLRPLLAAVACPTLVVGAADDRLTPPACSQELAALIPDAELQLLPDCGHMLTWEQPAVVGRLLQRWMARCDARLASAGWVARDPLRAG